MDCKTPPVYCNALLKADIVQVINFLSIFAKNEQSNLVLVLESKGPYLLVACEQTNEIGAQGWWSGETNLTWV